MRGWMMATMVTIVGAAIVGQAQACAVVMPADRSYATKMREARQRVEAAVAIVDGEVVVPYGGEGRPAVIRAERVLRGTALAEYKVGAETSCDIEFLDVGERFRVLLYGGPEVFITGVDQSEALYEDRVLKSDRRKVWPYRPGTPAAKPAGR